MYQNLHKTKLAYKLIFVIFLNMKLFKNISYILYPPLSTRGSHLQRAKKHYVNVVVLPAPMCVLNQYTFSPNVMLISFVG